MAEKVIGLRLFSDDAGKMNLALADVGGAVLVVSQFTLYGDASKGRRPSFIDAARPEQAIPAVRAVHRAAARGRRAGRDGRVRRDDGCRARERRSRHALARAMSRRVVLASASPRRRELLGLIGIAHEVHPADVDESVRPGESPPAYVERLARAKAQAVAAHHPRRGHHCRRHDGRAGRRHPWQAGRCRRGPAHARASRGAHARGVHRDRGRLRRPGRERRRARGGDVSHADGGGNRRVRRDGRADGQGRRLRHPGMGRHHRGPDRRRLLQRDGARIAAVGLIPCGGGR